MMNRRQFLKSAIAGLGVAMVPSVLTASKPNNDEYWVPHPGTDRNWVIDDDITRMYPTKMKALNVTRSDDSEVQWEVEALEMRDLDSMIQKSEASGIAGSCDEVIDQMRMAIETYSCTRSSERRVLGYHIDLQ